MGRFESPYQVVGLFIVAAVASVGIIFFVNAEAHSRLSTGNELPDFTVESKDDIQEPLSLPLSSSSKLLSSSELTSSYGLDSSSNYTSNSLLTSSVLEAGVATNVTLLNFLEDGLEKLLSLIKQAKNTYKSYYVHHVSGVKSSNESRNDKDGGVSSPSGLHHPRRRKKREAMKMESVTIKNASDGVNSRNNGLFKRAVISQSKRRKIGENEPYYWQMLEDNNRDSHHNHHHQHYHHQREEEEKDKPRDRPRLEHTSSSAGRGHYSNSQYPHYYPHHNQNQNQNQAASENHYFGTSSTGQAAAVASAFTGGAETVVHSVHNPTSDFHKIRHAMNKLGGGGLDISVVERMILDTKSSGRSHSPASSRDQQQKQHFNRMSGSPGHGSRNPPVSLLGKGHLANTREDDSSMPDSSLLTTAITKTTQQGRQDEGLFVNQLRQHQQQLAQSLLPPTVTWLNEGGDSTAVRYLPLPSSSLATGSEGEDEDDDDNSDGDLEEGNNSHEDNDGADTDDDMGNENDSNENPVSSGNPGGKEARRKMKRKKFEKAQRRNNNELSYARQPPSSSSSSSAEVDEDEDYQFRYGKGNLMEGNNNNKHNDNSDNNSNSYGDIRNNIIMGEEDDEEMEESKRMQENSLLEQNPPSIPPHQHDTSGGKGHNGKDCYHTDDVLIVVAITCCLNFAFVLVIWALVRWFSISSNPKEKDFQNLGDCDDTMDPTIVFHGVTEDPCWTLAAASAGGGGVSKEGESSSGLMTTRSNNMSGPSCGGIMGANMIQGGKGGMMGMIGSIHSVNKVDLFPTMGKLHEGGGAISMCGGDRAGVMTMSPVMTMTAERRLPYQNNLHIATGGRIGLGAGTMISAANVYSFKPEHVPTHHGSTGGMTRSYSQSMEDLRYLQ